MIYNKKIEDIVLNDIDELISQEIVEDKFLEYKKEMNNGEKDKILKTICGFSNADGGLFIYGLNEEKGKPVSRNGISLNESWDEKKRTILSWIETNIEPKVYVEIKNIELENDNILILIKVPKSWASPHCIKEKNGKKRSFYIRRDGSTDPMEFREIEMMFSSKNIVMDKINEFREERLKKFSSENIDNFKVIYHFIPLDSFLKEYININEAKTKIQKKKRINGEYKYNFEGIYCHNSTFNQLFRNGIFEMSYESNPKNKSISLENHLDDFIKSANEIFDLYRELDIYCPIVLFISITNMKGCPIKIDPMFDPEVSDKERDILNPNGVLIENKDEIDSAIHNMFIPLWNHYGIEVDYN